jgi:hypothetical protein
MPLRKIAVCSLTFGLTLLAQPFTVPDTYSLTQINSLFGPPVTINIYRNGSNAVVAHQSSGSHSQTLYNLQTHQSLSWDTVATGGGCGAGTFSGDWGDPFASTATLAGDLEKQGAKQVGTESIAGIPAKVMEADTKDGKVRVALDPKSGLILKMQLTPAGGAARTLIEISSASFTAPPAAIFTPPAACAAAAATPPPQPLSPDFSKAIMGPASANSCTVLFRVVRADTMAPIASGFQVAIDPKIDFDHPASYSVGIDPQGHAIFAGGGLKDLTGQLRNGVLRLDNAPATFDIETVFGKAGSSSAVIYRQCPSPQTVLLLVVKNPQKLSDGSDWLWVKSGKYATLP